MTSQYEGHVIEFNHLININQQKLALNPGRYYSRIWDLNSPVLCSGTEDYCSHLQTVPEWLWKKLQETACDYLERNRMLKYGGTSRERIDHLQAIKDGNFPYNLRMV